MLTRGTLSKLLILFIREAGKIPQPGKKRKKNFKNMTKGKRKEGEKRRKKGKRGEKGENIYHCC